MKEEKNGCRYYTDEQWEIVTKGFNEMGAYAKSKGMYSTKTGKTFDGVVLLADTGGKYVNFRVEQNRK